MKSAEEAVDYLFGILGKGHDSEYIGEPISQLEHALQCAKIAVDGKNSDAFIIAALFHDIGHLSAGVDSKRMDEFGVDAHHHLGANLLRACGFSEEVAQLIEGHVEAKRFLVAQNPKYVSELSLASQETLKRQGGPMKPEEVENFRNNPLLKAMLRLRVCDDQAKRVGWEVPSLQSYREKLMNHLANASVIGTFRNQTWSSNPPPITG